VLPTAAVGGVVSTVHVKLAGAPVFVAASVAFTWKVCEPSATLVSETGEEQALQAPESSLHWKVALSEAENAKLGAVSFDDAAGVESKLVVGAVVSIVQAKLAGPPVLLALSVALTSKVCGPGARPVYAAGEVQDAYAAPSSEQVNVPGFVEVNEKLASVWFVGLLGCAVIEGAGSVVSTVHVNVDGAPVLPAGSVDSTAKVWEPSPRPV
jgi:hypothetical protein